MVVHVIIYRTAVSLKGLTHHRQVMPRALLRHQKGPYDFARMVILSQDQDVFALRMGHPHMERSVMLEQYPDPALFKAHIGFSFALTLGVIQLLPDGPSPDGVAMNANPVSLLALLGQKREVDASPKIG